MVDHTSALTVGNRFSIGDDSDDSVVFFRMLARYTILFLNISNVPLLIK